MSEYVYAGLTSQSIDVMLRDSSSTTGAGLTGLAFNTSGLKAYYRKGATGTATAITLATQTVGGAFSSGGFVEVDATNMAGVYRLDLPNAAVDTEGFVTLFIYGATNLVPTAQRIDCRALPVDVKKFGATNGTFSSGRPEVNTTHVAGTSQTAGDIPGILGALNAAASSGDPGTTTTLVAYLKQIVNTLEGTAGIPTFPAAAAPANAVSLAEVIRSIYSQIGVAGAGLTAVGDTRLANLDATVSTRLATTGYTAPLDAAGTRSAVGLATANLDIQLSGINTKTTNLPAAPASEGNVTAVGLAVTALGSPLQAGSYTAPDNTTISTINTKLGTPAASVSADIAAVKTDTGNLVNRITANLFSGITYLSRWLGALAGKTADTVTRAEINATTAGAGYNETTDSLQAIRDQGDAAWVTGSGGGGSGSGAYTLTITVNDGTTALQNATVRLTEGSNTYTANTNASGVATFGLDAATYSVAITKAGYQFTPTTKVVSGTGSQTYSMTQVSITPSAADQVTGYLTCYTEAGVIDTAAQVTIQQIKSAGTGLACDGAERTATANGSGVIEFTGLFPGAQYTLWRGTKSTAKPITFTLPADATDPTELKSIVGVP